MNNSKKVFAIIPARGGSKRIKKKNIKIFNKKPMIYWPLKVLKMSKLFDKIIVSTDDKNIKDASLKFGADIVIDRPKELSDDITGTQDVIKHSIRYLEDKKFKIDYVCCVYPCTPFLQITDLKKAANLAYKYKKFVFPILEYSHPIQRAMYLNKKNDLSFLNKKNENIRTQDLKKTYHDAGQFYFANKKTWISAKKMHSYSKGIVLPGWRVVDIDNSDDWVRAEKILNILKNH
jgi:pseudaminic acid cytidylyltransferase